MHMAKERRRRLISELLQRSRILSQEELGAALAARGEKATQATLSRDLREMGVLKGPDGYHMPFDTAPLARVDGASESGETARELAAALRRHLVGAEPAASLIVARTAPGHASVLAVELDRHLPQGVVGVLAGDDTIFLAARSESDARRVARRLRQIAGIHEPRRESA